MDTQTETEELYELKEEERAAMRAYLQRAEVRLSTMHRVAGIFLNGAGLLFLFPVFFRDAFVKIINNIFAFNSRIGIITSLFMLLISLGVPLWALYLLIKDMVTFYFTAYHAGLREKFFHPRFILSGISFSEDESKYVKESVIASQQTEDMLSFIIPPDVRDKKGYKSVLAATGGQIIPQKRRKYIPKDDDVLNENVSLFNTALGLAGVVDRTMIQEVAKMEMSLVRHAINLRHLVLRYSKALLLFLLTTVVFIIGAELMKIPQLVGELSTEQTSELINAAVARRQLLYLSFIFLLWAILTPIIVTRPIAWIYRYAANSLIQIQSDREIAKFERYVIFFSIAVFICASLSVPFCLPYEISWSNNSFVVVLLVALAFSIGCIFLSLWYLFVRNKEIYIKEVIPERKLRRDKQPQKNNPDIPADNKAASVSKEIEDGEYDFGLLHQKINEKFNDKELGDLFESVDLDYEEFVVYGKSEKAKQLVFYFNRLDDIPKLITALEQKRPNFNWRSLKKLTTNR
jgi:hypothetical protein